jgi:hypothetical protein
MAKDDEKKPTAADKGKGKAPVQGDADKGKDAKPDVEDNKGGVATTGGMFRLRDRWCCYRDACILMANYRRAQRGGPATQERARHAGGADTGKLPGPVSCPRNVR